jgi:hypothetical protein
VSRATTPVRALALLVLLALALLLAAVLSSCATRPDWHLARIAQDGPVTAPRYAHHALRALGGGVAYGTARWAGVPPDVAELGADLAAGVLPHVVGVSVGAYPFDGPDWAADLGITAVGPWLTRRCARLWSKRCARAVLVAGGAYAALAPWSSP